MFAEIGKRMGWSDAFSYDGPAAIFREHAALSAFENDGGRVFDIGSLAGIADTEYDTLAPIQWPAPKAGAASARLFARGGFPTGDGRARMVALTPQETAEGTSFSLTLNTGRVRDQWHTMTRTGRVFSLMTHISTPSLALHPRDAAMRGITDGGLVRIESDNASTVMRAAIDEGVRPGSIFAPMHWTDEFTSSGPIGRLVHAATDPVSGQPDLKGTRVRLFPVTEVWRGHLLRLADGAPETGTATWWAKAPIEAGFSFEMAGSAPLEDEIRSEAQLRRLLALPGHAEIVSYSDPRKAMFRYAGILEGRLAACAFFGLPDADFSGIGQAKSLIGQNLQPFARLSLLAGLSASAPPSRTVCSCFSVSEETIRKAVTEKGLVTPSAIGFHTKAGTNCGSCIPELKKILSEEMLASNS
jgi:assimilatory nitrate reductase catalytic subunit